jgi:hypothetical protein
MCVFSAVLNTYNAGLLCSKASVLGAAIKERTNVTSHTHTHTHAHIIYVYIIIIIIIIIHACIMICIKALAGKHFSVNTKTS